MSQFVNSEKWLEQELGKQVERIGGRSIKFSSATDVGYPDRILVFPHSILVWVELKSRGEHPRPVQEIRHEQLRRLGQRVEVIDRPTQIDNLIRSIKDQIKQMNNANVQRPS